MEFPIKYRNSICFFSLGKRRVLFKLPQAGLTSWLCIQMIFLLTMNDFREWGENLTFSPLLELLTQSQQTKTMKASRWEAWWGPGVGPDKSRIRSLAWLSCVSLGTSQTALQFFSSEKRSSLAEWGTGLSGSLQTSHNQSRLCSSHDCYYICV